MLLRQEIEINHHSPGVSMLPVYSPKEKLYRKKVHSRSLHLEQVHPGLHQITNADIASRSSPQEVPGIQGGGNNLSVFSTALWVDHSAKGLHKITKVLTRALAEQGASVLVHLDDRLILAPSQKLLLKAEQMVISTTESMGFLINRQKPHLSPTQTLDW